MKRRKIHNRICLLTITIALLFAASCSTTKYIPDGSYLLDQLYIHTDSNQVSESELIPYIKQMPNSPKLGLRIFNMVDNDSNWFKKTIRKLGEAPIIFSEAQMNQSVTELSIRMKNLGYLNTNVYAEVDTLNKKAVVNYYIHEGTPYRVRRYSIDLSDSEMNDLVSGNFRRSANTANRDSTQRPQNARRNTRTIRPMIAQGAIFDMNTLEGERNRVRSILRNRGYYAATLNNLHYLADTTLRSHEVDLTMIVNDTTFNRIYRIEKIKVFSGYDPAARRNYHIKDSIEKNGIMIYYDSIHFLRPNVIASKVLLRPGGLFRERAAESTYNLFQSLGCVNRVNVELKEGNYPDSTLLDCEIYLTPGNVHSLRTGLEGTNKAGDFGVALDINYGHQNLFNGSETFNLHLRGAYEFVSKNSFDNLNHNFYEFEINPSLSFPRIHLPYVNQYLNERYNNPQTQYSLGLTVQKRPEYTRNFFNFNWKFRWANRTGNLTHSLSLVDLNLIFMSQKSNAFQEYLDNSVSPLVKVSYEDVFTAGVKYNLIYSNANTLRAHSNSYTIRFNVETSGNLLRGMGRLFRAEKNSDGEYTIIGNPYAQYVKSDIDYSQAVKVSTNSVFAFRAGLGIALPYGNSRILPFEKRYYAGGPNNVRGWRTRYLGPGSFNRGRSGDQTVHVGDINFILSAEYRYKVMKWLEPAFFVDCGNVWTIKDYPDQQGGYFRWNSFYEELAVGTGIGLRFDLSFLILRLDAGTKVYDPAKEKNDRFVWFKNKFLNNSALYIAIGYPF